MHFPTIPRGEIRQVVGLSLAAVALGLIGAVTAFALYRLIMLITNLAFFQRVSFAVQYPPDRIAPWMVFIPALGGLLVGLTAYFGTERIRGHGIPEAMEAIVTKRSQIDLRVAILKPISAAIAVGTGGPFGAEGPIIQTGGAIGSLAGQALHLSTAERKVFLACGAAAGMAGIFNTPLSAVAITLELLLFELRPRSLIPVVIASAVAAATRTYLIGSGTMFPVPPIKYGGPLALPFFIPLGVLVGIAAVIVSKGLFQVEELFDETLHLPIIIGPAIGGLILGLIALVEPAVLGMGYPTITAIVEGRYGPLAATKIAVAKSLALWAALGSGTSGGLLAPMLMIGGAIGSAYGQIVVALFPGVPIQPEICGIVAMSALFGAAARIPVTSFLFGFELTGDYHAVVPLMIGCMVADVVARLLTEHSVMTERLARRGIEIPRVIAADVLSYLKVRAFLRCDVARVPADTPLRRIVARPARTEGWPDQFFPGIATPVERAWIVESPDGAAVGWIGEEQLLRAESNLAGQNQTVGQIACPMIAVAHPEETMDDAVRAMLRYGLDWLPVVSPWEPRRVVGYVALSDALAARRMNLEDEVIRESILQPGLFQAGAELVQRIARNDDVE
ncbi:MAG: chloride channel protein [Chloroflexota bacterium]